MAFAEQPTYSPAAPRWSRLGAPALLRLLRAQDLSFFPSTITKRSLKNASPTAPGNALSGAADEHTLRWNQEAYQRIRLRPRVLVDVSKLDTARPPLRSDLAYPIILAPTGGRN
jgi:hypothetical protein